MTKTKHNNNNRKRWRATRTQCRLTEPQTIKNEMDLQSLAHTLSIMGKMEMNYLWDAKAYSASIIKLISSQIKKKQNTMNKKCVSR